MFARLTTKRRVVQVIAAVLLTCNFTAFTSNWVSFGNVCLPVIHCNACPLTWFMCPIYTISEYAQFRAVPWATLAPWMLLAILGGIGLLLGRLFCGWICPIGLLQEVVHYVPTPKVRFPMFLRWLKYAFLFISVLAVAYWVSKDVMYFFCKYCPVATIEVTVPQMVAGGWAMDVERIVRLSVLATVLVMVLFNIRSFCKVMCPVGALMAFTNKFSLFTIKLDPAKCIHCGKCDKSCPMGVPVEHSSRTERSVNRHTECIECLKCQEVCPVKAIRNNSHVLK